MKYTLGTSAAEQERLLAQRSLYNDLQDIELFPEDRVIELGCGPGANLACLATKATSYHGVDILQAQTESASAMASFLGLDNCRFTIADAADTGLASASASVVVTRLVLVHHPDVRAVLKEARRLLAPGGRLIISEPDDLSLSIGPDCQNLMRCWIIKTALLRGMPVADLFINRWIHALPALIQEAGFNVVETSWHNITANRNDREKLSALAQNWLFMINQVRPQLLASGLIDQLMLDRAASEADQAVDKNSFASVSLLNLIAEG